MGKFTPRLQTPASFLHLPPCSVCLCSLQSISFAELPEHCYSHSLGGYYQPVTLRRLLPTPWRQLSVSNHSSPEALVFHALLFSPRLS